MRKIMVLATAAALLVACKDNKQAQPAPPVAEAPKAADPTAAALPGSKLPPVAGPRPASIKDTHVASAEKMIGALKAMGESLTAAGADCKAATAALKAHSGKLVPVMDEAEKMKAETEADAAAREWFQAAYAPKLMDAMGPLVKTAQECAEDQDFMAALDTMPMPGKKPKNSP